MEITDLNKKTIGDDDAIGLKIEEHKEYIHFVASGKRHSLKKALRMWRRIIEEVRNRKFKKFLVEKQISTGLTTLEMYELVTFIAKQNLFGHKMSLYDSFAAHSDVNHFGEIVGLNRGLNGRVFTNKDKALEWLLSD